MRHVMHAWQHANVRRCIVSMRRNHVEAVGQQRAVALLTILQAGRLRHLDQMVGRLHLSDGLAQPLQPCAGAV